jgi:hypothetical protein
MIIERDDALWGSFHFAYGAADRHRLRELRSINYLLTMLVHPLFMGLGSMEQRHVRA